MLGTYVKLAISNQFRLMKHISTSNLLEPGRAYLEKDKSNCLKRVARSHIDGCRIHDTTTWKHSIMSNPDQSSVHKMCKCALDKRATTPVRRREDTHYSDVGTSRERHVGQAFLSYLRTASMTWSTCRHIEQGETSSSLCS